MNSKDEEGVIVAQLKQLTHERIPRLLELKEKVNGGERLNDQDINYLEMAMDGSKKGLRVADKYPEYKDIVTKVISLHQEITEKDLELENNKD